MRISDWSSDVCSSDLMRFAPRNAKDCAFFVPLRSFRRPNDSIRRKFDSGHRPFIARAPKRVMINAGFAVTARFDFWGSTMRKTFTSLAFAALASLGQIGRAHV